MIPWGVVDEVTVSDISSRLKEELLKEKNAVTVIEPPDDQAASLRAKAASQGLTLTDWLQMLAQRNLTEAKERSAKDAVGQILDLQKDVKPDFEGWTVKDYVNCGRP